MFDKCDGSFAFIPEVSDTLKHVHDLSFEMGILKKYVERRR